MICNAVSHWLWSSWKPLCSRSHADEVQCGISQPRLRDSDGRSTAWLHEQRSEACLEPDGLGLRTSPPQTTVDLAVVEEQRQSIGLTGFTLGLEWLLFSFFTIGTLFTFLYVYFFFCYFLPDFSSFFNTWPKGVHDILINKNSRELNFALKLKNRNKLLVLNFLLQNTTTKKKNY